MNASQAILCAAMVLKVGMLVIETAQTIQHPLVLVASCAIGAWLVLVT